MKIEKRQKFPITNSYPWRCHGIKSNPHPEIENYDQCCDFPGCQEKCFQIPYRSPKFALTGVGIIAFIAFIPMIYDAIHPYNGQTRFQYGGATAFAPIRDDDEKQIEKYLSKTLKIPKLDLIYSQNNEDSPGTTSGIKMLIDKQLSFSQGSRSLTEQEITEAKKLNLIIKDTPVAIDGIAIFINPDLNISQLTLEQVRDLFTGEIRNWREVGGPSEQVTPISLSSDSQEGDTADFFQKYVMQAKPFAGSSQEVKTPTIAMQCVAKSQDCPLTPLKGYISYASVCNQQQIRICSYFR
jgi:ABC-type phosphate transport system substrate-binding protein